MKKFASILITSLLFLNVAYAAGNSKDGEQKSSLCSACHGQAGKKPVIPEAPVLAGQHASYLLEQLKAFKSGSRNSPIMAGQVANLSDDDMNDLSAYYASQIKQPIAITEEEKIQGEGLYRGGNSKTGVAACIGCHGPKGTGNEAAKFPSISGQTALYIETALKQFRDNAKDASKGRTSAHNGMMNGVAAAMTDKEISAIAKYIGALH